MKYGNTKLYSVIAKDQKQRQQQQQQHQFKRRICRQWRQMQRRHHHDMQQFRSTDTDVVVTVRPTVLLNCSFVQQQSSLLRFRTTLINECQQQQCNNFGRCCRNYTSSSRNNTSWWKTMMFSSPPTPQQQELHWGTTMNPTSMSRITGTEGAVRNETIEEMHYRYSLVNAHPLGPWQAIVNAVQIHYYNTTVTTQTNAPSNQQYRERDGTVESSSSSAASSSPNIYQITSTATATNAAASDTTTTTTDSSSSLSNSDNDMTKLYKVLDVGCGPRGEPGTTIARALLSSQQQQLYPAATNYHPNNNTLIHCIDSCPIAIHTVPTICTITTTTDNPTTNESSKQRLSTPSPPMNLIKSVCNLDQLSEHFAPNSMNAIVSCFGYGSSMNNDQVQQSLQQAYDILIPGGILILCTWQYSSLLSLSYDIITTLHHGSGDPAYMIRQQQEYDRNEMGIPPPFITYSNGKHCISGERPTIQYSGPNEWEVLLHNAGFRCRNKNNDSSNDTNISQTITTINNYPIHMGNTIQEQINFGTLLIPTDLQNHYYKKNHDETTTTTTNENQEYTHPNDNCKSSQQPRLYRNNIEEAFWMNVSDYTTTATTTTNIALEKNSSMWLPKNIYKLTISTK